MERQPSFVERALKRVPVLGWLGSRAVEAFGSQGTYHRAIQHEDSVLADEETALEALAHVASDDIRIYQLEVIALIRAKRLCRHLELGEDDIDERAVSLYDVISQLPPTFTLDNLGLPLDQVEALRIKLKELE